MVTPDEERLEVRFAADVSGVSPALVDWPNVHVAPVVPQTGQREAGCRNLVCNHARRNFLRLRSVGGSRNRCAIQTCDCSGSAGQRRRSNLAWRERETVPVSVTSNREADELS